MGPQAPVLVRAVRAGQAMVRPAALALAVGWQAPAQGQVQSPCPAARAHRTSCTRRTKGPGMAPRA